MVFLGLVQCAKEKPPHEPVSTQDSLAVPQGFCFDGGFPVQKDSCLVQVVNFEASYGKLQKDSFVYDTGGRLVEKYFFVDGAFNSLKLFEYINSCSTINILGDNDRDGVGSLLGQLVYKDKRLTHFLHFNPADVTDTLSFITYLYQNGVLRQVIARSEQEARGEVFLDNKGNVKRMVINSIDGVEPSPKPEAGYKYSSILNPHYMQPALDLHEFRFFSPHVCEGIVGQAAYDLEATTGNLLKTHIDSFSQGVHTQMYHYTCL